MKGNSANNQQCTTIITSFENYNLQTLSLHDIQCLLLQLSVDVKSKQTGQRSAVPFLAFSPLGIPAL